MSMQKNSLTLVLLLLMSLAGITQGLAQVQISSPYSRYGLGDMQARQFDRGLGMGGVGYAYRDPLTLNIKNPASFSGFDTVSFLCNVGVVSFFNQLQTTSAVQSFNNMTSLGYLSFGFPITRWWGASIGLVPYSHTGYKIITKDTITGAGSFSQEYEGTGSLNRFYMGHGFKLHRDLSVGVNASFLFGTINNIKSVYFNDLSYVFNTRITNSMVINDFNFEAGLQYHHTFKNKMFINAGLVYQVPFGMKGRKTYLVERFVSSSTSEITRDSIEYIHNQNGIIHIPGGLGGGLMVGKKEIWMVGADVAWQNWDNYTTFGQKDSLKSSLAVNLGFQITPKHSSVSNYFKKVAYRAGFRYENTYLNVHTQPINEYAVSAGLGFPFRKTGSAINVSVEFGQRGTTKELLIKETFIRGIIGLSIKEFWFYRRKLD
jgi:hypothetical protein